MIEANKFYFLYDREGFVRTTGVNQHMVRILDKLGPIKIQMTRGDSVYNIFETLDGRIMTGDHIAKEYDFKWSFHITERESRFFKEAPTALMSVEPQGQIRVIPEIRLTITTIEEAHAAYVMLKGLLDASV